MLNRNSWKQLLLLLLLGFSTGMAYSQNITVRGTIRNKESKEALPQAKVFAPDDNIGTLSGLDGTYSLQLSRRDTLHLIVSFPELETQDLRIAVKPEDKTMTVDVAMGEAESEVGDVIITASKTEQKAEELSVSYSLIKPKTVDLQASANIQNSLENTPGIAIQDDQINIRSTSGYAYGVGSRVTLALNGMPLLSANANSAEFDLVPTDNIKQVEIIKGASSVLFGSSALGGVVNIITDAPGDRPYTSIRMRGSIYDRPANRALDWDGTSAPFESSFHLFHARKFGEALAVTIQTDLIKESGYRQGEESEQGRFKFITNWTPAKIKGLSVGFMAAYSIDSSGSFLFWNGYHPDTSLVITPGALPLTYDTNMVLTGGALSPAAGTLRKQLNKRLSLDPTISYLTKNGSVHTLRGRLLGGYFTNSTNQSSYNTLSYGEYLFTKPLFKSAEKFDLTFVGGLNFIRSKVLSDSIFGNHHIDMMAAYAQMNFKVGSRLNGNFGGRYQYNVTDGDTVSAAPILAIGLNYKIALGTHVRASFGQAFRSPSVAERFTATSAGGLPVLPNPGLLDEKGWSAELGLQQGFMFAENWKGFVDLAVFRMNYTNMIEYMVKKAPPGSSFPLGFGPSNVSAAQITGYEISTMGSGKLGPFRLTFSGGYTFTNPIDLNYNPDSTYNIDDPTTFTFPDRPEILKYRFKQLGRGMLQLDYKKMYLTAFYRYNSRMESMDQQLWGLVKGVREYWDGHREGNGIWDFVLGYNFDNSVLSFHCQNAFNREYTLVPWILAKQRQYVVQWKFMLYGKTKEELKKNS